MGYYGREDPYYSNTGRDQYNGRDRNWYYQPEYRNTYDRWKRNWQDTCRAFSRKTDFLEKALTKKTIFHRIFPAEITTATTMTIVTTVGKSHNTTMETATLTMTPDPTPSRTLIAEMVKQKSNSSSLTSSCLVDPFNVYFSPDMLPRLWQYESHVLRSNAGKVPAW